MAGYKKVKQRKTPSDKGVKQVAIPIGKGVVQPNDPNSYYGLTPSWNFAACDREKWSIFSNEVRDVFWDEVLPRMQGLETQTWGQILVDSKKQNHSEKTETLNKGARDRLVELKIEQESVHSLRITGTHRIYGIISAGVFSVLWVDLDHGDNDTCVCRSTLKYT